MALLASGLVPRRQAEVVLGLSPLSLILLDLGSVIRATTTGLLLLLLLLLLFLFLFPSPVLFSLFLLLSA